MKILNKYTIIGAAVIIAGVILYFVFKRRTTILSQLPADNQPGENSQLTDTEKETVKNLATSLYNQLSGWSWIFGRSPEPYEQLATASDRITVGTYNYFNSNFAKGSGTLYTWIKNDWFYTRSRAGAAVLLIFQKFDRLNLV